MVAFLFSCIIGFAQPKQHGLKKGEGREKIKALYIAYMTQELELTETEAQKFWPVHDQFSAEVKAVNKDAGITELGREEASLNIKKKYNDKFSRILGNDRTNLFFKKDKEFRSKLVDEIKDKRGKYGDRKDKQKKAGEDKN